MDAFDRIMELSRQGLYCAQIMVQLALDAEGRENPELVQAVRGLCGGFAWSGGPCGVLSGGVCFRERTAQYGGEDCDCILEGDRRNMFKTCPGIVMDSYAKCAELLSERGLA